TEFRSTEVQEFESSGPRVGHWLNLERRSQTTAFCSTPPARAPRSMQMGQNSLSAVAENFVPQTVQARISRAVKSTFLRDSSWVSRGFELMAGSILRQPLKLRKVRESRRRRQQGLRPCGQSPRAPMTCTVCASDVQGLYRRHTDS